MRQWLETGTPTERQLAEWRIARGFEEPYETVTFDRKSQTPVPVVPIAVDSEPTLPSATRQVIGFIASAVKVIASGFERVSDGEYADRVATCTACPGGHYRPSDGRCGKMTGCGCYVMEKASYAAVDCPGGYWPKPGQKTAPGSTC